MTTAVVLSNAAVTAQPDVRSEQATTVQEAPKPRAPIVGPRKARTAPIKKLEDATLGTRTLYAWAEWLKQNSLGLADCRVSLQKDAVRLNVYKYLLPDGGTTCVVLKVDDSLPKTIMRLGAVVQSGESRIREFREWKQGIEVVLAKLMARGWSLLERK